MTDSDATPILLVDADDERLRSLSEVLTESGYDTITASDPDEALEALSEHPEVQGIVVSWHLPETNGLKLIRQALKSRFEGAVVLYDCPKPQLAEEKLEEWAEERSLEFMVLEEPSDEGELLEALESVLNTEDLDELSEEEP